MIVLLELLTALLEYIDLILQLLFSQQEFTLSYKYLTYYAGIMPGADPEFGKRGGTLLKNS